MGDNKVIDYWRRCYSIVLPFLVCVIYLTIYILTQKGVLDFQDITESKNFTAMLESIITFVSIIIGVFGFLLPILITSKDKFALIKYFINSIDKKSFSFNLRMIIVGGFATVFITCMLFFFDIFSEWFKQLMILMWIWLLFYFMLNSYRFISLLVRLFLEEKHEPRKDQRISISKSEEEELKKIIKEQNQKRLS